MNWSSLMLLAIVIAATKGNNTTKESSQISVTSKPTNDGVDLNKTVLEVEKILDKYPELPRIDRKEILNILQNITEEDNAMLKKELTEVLEEEKLKMQEKKSTSTTTPAPSKDGVRKEKVMVVLPFKAEDDEDSLEELYTRSPIVMIEEQKAVEVKATTYAPKRRTTTITTFTAEDSRPGFSIIEKEDPKFNPPLRVIGFRYHTTQEPEIQSTKRSSTSYANFQDPEQVTMAFRTHEFRGNHKWNHKEGEQTTKEEEAVATEGFRKGTVLDDEPPKNPKKSSANFHVPDSMDNFSFEDAMVENSQVEDLHKVDAPTTRRSRPAKVVTTTPTTTTIRTYITTKKPIKKEEKTTTTEETFWSTTQVPTKKKYKNKNKTADKANKSPVPQNLANVLDNLPPHLKEMLSNIGIDQGISFSESTEAPEPVPDKTINAHIDPSSYHSFKPLPLKRQKTVSEDMQQFLASFGLIDNSRHQKAMETSTNAPTTQDDRFLHSAPKINPDFLTDTMKKTLDSLGLYDTPSIKSQKHIFNPKNHTNAQSDEEVKKLNTLLSTIRKLASLNDSEPVTLEFQQEILQQVKDLDNITISYKTSEAINEEIHKIMERNKGKFKIPVIMKESSAENTLQSGLNPEFYEDIQLKNEVKRQENGTSEKSSTSSPTEDPSTTTEPANNPALEDAFGGGDTAPAGSDPADSLPPKRPNGLYFLLDWNTFFEVGTEDDSRRVNIRFQPKVGDGRNFLPVSIP